MRILVLNLTITLLLQLPVFAANLYVSPSGSSSGTGTLSRPYDLRSALSGRVGSPGDTFWLRGGTYSLGNLETSIRGASGSPITFRSYPGEWARIAGSLHFHTSPGHVVLRDLEIHGTNASRSSSKTSSTMSPGDLGTLRPGIFCAAPNLKFINLIVRDHRQHGIYVGSTASNTEVNGCIIYNNGWHSYGQSDGHNIYVQSDRGPVVLRDNIAFNATANNYQIYTSHSGASLLNVTLTGNIGFGAGALTTRNSKRFRNFVVGIDYPARRADQITFRHNFVYVKPGTVTRQEVQLGRDGTNGRLVQESNYLPYGVLYGAWQDRSGSNLSAGRSGTRVFIRSNKNEQGRAHLVVYNWDQLSSVSVNLSSILSPGAAYEIRNAQDYGADPILRGTYDGSNVRLPMSGLSVAAPLGLKRPAEIGPGFNVFVLTSTEAPAVTKTPNTAPGISSIPDQRTLKGTSVGPLAFTISDAETSSSELGLVASSSNTTLIPNQNLKLGGSRSKRTITVTPAASGTGSATITIHVNDGNLTSQTSFKVTVANNRAPVISSIPDLSIAPNTATAKLSFQVTDRDTPSDDLRVTSDSSDFELIHTNDIVLGGSGADRWVQIFPARDRTGTATIALRVWDPQGLKATTRFTVTVGANTAPTITTIASQVISRNTSTARIPFRISDGQTPVEDLVVTSDSSDFNLVPTSNIVLGGTGHDRWVQITPTANRTGTVTITLRAWDPQEAAGTTSFRLSVE